MTAPQPSVTVIKSSTELADKRLTLQGQDVMTIRWSITYLEGYLCIKKVILEVFSYALSSGPRWDGSLPIGYALTRQCCLCKYTILKNETNLYKMTKGITESAVMGKRLPAGTNLIVTCQRVFRGIWIVWWRLQ